jgi:hypothetical protein
MNTAQKNRGRKISVLAVGNSAKRGWLYKQGGRIKTWKKRYFVLNSNTLYYYKSEGDKEPKGAISLKNCIITYMNQEETKKEGKTPVPFSVKIKSPFRAYWLCGETENEMTSWQQSLTKASKISIFDIRDTSRKVGIMLKQGGTIKNWKVRYFVLRDHMLCYHKSEQESNEVAQGVVALLNAKVQPLRNKTAQSGDDFPLDDISSDTGTTDSDIETREDFTFSFKVTNPIRTYVMATKTQQECDQWVFMINQDILRVINPLVAPIIVGVPPVNTDEKSIDETSSPGKTPQTYKQEKNLLSKTISDQHKTNKSNQKHQSQENDTTSPAYRPMRVIMRQGIFEDDGAMTISKPTQIQGEGIGETCLILKYPISVRSFNVKFQSMTIKIVGPSTAYRTSGGDIDVSCIINISDQSSCYFEDCELIYDCTASSSSKIISGAVFVSNMSQCYMQNTNIKGAQHGLVVAGESTALTQNGTITSRSDCVKNFDKGETRMYDTAVVGEAQ